MCFTVSRLETKSAALILCEKLDLKIIDLSFNTTWTLHILLNNFLFKESNTPSLQRPYSFLLARRPAVSGSEAYSLTLFEYTVIDLVCV